MINCFLPYLCGCVYKERTKNVAVTHLQVVITPPFTHEATDTQDDSFGFGGEGGCRNENSSKPSTDELLGEIWLEKMPIVYST